MMSTRRQKEQNFQSNGQLQKLLCTVNLAASPTSGLMVSSKYNTILILLSSKFSSKSDIWAYGKL